MENNNFNKLTKKVLQHSRKNNEKQKTHKNKVEEYLKKCVSKMTVKQNKLMEKHNFGDENNKFVLYPERNTFFLFNKKTNKVFFKAKFQIIGTFSEKSKTWRWGWSNRYVPYDLKQTSLKIKKFGEANKVEFLSQPKIKKEDMGLVFTALGMDLSRSYGYYIVPGTTVYPSIYIIFTQVSKIDEDYKDIVNEMKEQQKANTKFMQSKIKTMKKNKSKDKGTLKPKPKDTKPKETKTKEKETKPKDTKTKDTKPKDTKPKDTKPKDTKPKDTKPKDTKTKDRGIPILKTSKQNRNHIMAMTKIHLERTKQNRITETNNNNEDFVNPKNNILIPVKTKKIRRDKN